MAEPLIQTTDLSRTFQALRNRNPEHLEKQQVPNHPDYRRIPSSNYSPITTCHTGSWGNGMAKFASSGGIVYGQPQFFSPVHTPINWQIPSKRLEEYQWMYLPNTKVLREDFTYESIESNIFNCDNIIDDNVTGGFIFETNSYPKILNSEGEFNQPPRIGMRECVDKRCFNISTIGNYGEIKVSEEHNIFVLDGKAHRRNKKALGNKKYRASKGIKPNGVEKVKIQNRLIKKIKAQDVSRNDYLLTPVPKVGNISIDKDLAWLIGFCAADGCIYEKDGSYSVRFTGYKEEKALMHCKEILERNFDGKITSNPHGDGNGWRINASTKKAYDFFRKYILNKGIEKKFSKEIFNLDLESRLNVLAGYFDGDGCYEKGQRKLISTCYSKDLADQTYWLLISCEISASIGRFSLSDNHYPTSSECFYRVIIPSPEVSNIFKYMNSGKVPSNFIAKKQRLLKFFYTEDGITYLTNPIEKIKEFLYTGKGFDIEMTNERRALVADGYIGSNCRFFYQNEPKVAAAIDFYSEFPMSNWEHECRNRTVKLYFDRFKERLKLQKWCRLISHEVHLLGDCFPFWEIDCPICNGSGRIGSDICEHDGGTVRRIIILNPDYVEVLSSPLNPDPIIAMRPDEELINMVQRKTPGYEKLSSEVRKLISTGQPIKLDNGSVSHLKYGENGYAKYGIGMVRRLFPVLSYKTKLMVAQWIVAERLIVPIKIVKVGSDERPAGPSDIAAVQSQLAQTANDPNLTIVTHHAFEMDFIGACHDNETEVLTKDGWKLFKDATINDEIGTYNLNNGKLEYQIPTEKQEYNYNGEMYEFFGKHINVKVTPNHNMLASKMKYKNGKPDGYREWAKIRADEISHNDRFVNLISWDGEIPNILPYKDTMLGHLDLNTYLEFVGYYLSEGGIKVSEGSPDAIHLTQKVNSDYYERMKQLMELVKDNSRTSLHVDAKSSDGQPIAQIIISSRKLAKEMMSIYGHKSYGKFIPKWILNLPCEKLRILFDAMVNGDGSRRFSEKGKLRIRYNTVSKQMADDVFEIGMKLGYSVSIKKEDAPKYKNYNTHDIYRIHMSLGNEEKYRTIRKKGIKKSNYSGMVYCFTVPNGYIITRRNGRVGIHGNSGKVLTLSNEFELINQEILDGMMINNALLNGEGPNFSAAAVGIEAMIQRLKTFREQITDWLRESIYIPEARRQAAAGNEAFITKNEDTGEEEVVVPKIKWDNMHLRDQQQFRTFVMQLYEKGLLSAQTVLETFDFDPDQEIERKRYDALQMVALGQGLQGGMGGGGGGMGGGGGGGMGGLPMPGGGGEPPIGAPDMGGPGTPSEGPSAPTGGGDAIAKSSSITATEVDPSQFGGRVLKKRTRERIQSEQQKQQRMQDAQQRQQQKVMDAANGGNGGTQRDEKGRIINTKAERDLIPHLKKAAQDGLFGNYAIVKQFRVQAQDEEYPLDFALPALKVGIEADGEIFHSAPKQKAHDKERDMKLSQQGWTIIRFTDEEIEKNPQQVVQSIIKTVMQKQLYMKNMATGNVEQKQPQQ